jgi:uncharacterized membrane protein
MFNKKQESELHWFFEVSVFLKGIHAILEIAGGFLILLVSQNFITQILLYLSQESISDNGNDFLANHLMNFLQNFSVGTKHFIAFYLLSHGIVKLFLVYGLLKEKLIFFPLAIFIFSFFAFYQVERYFYTHSLILLFLTILDLVVIGLTLHEWSHKSKYLKS